MKGKALAAGAAVGAAIALGVGAREVSQDGGACQKPLTLLESEQTASIAELERYISIEIAPDLKKNKNLQWGSDDFTPTLLPGRIAARIFLMAAGALEPSYYYVALERECAGDDWKVVEFDALPRDKA